MFDREEWEARRKARREADPHYLPFRQSDQPEGKRCSYVFASELFDGIQCGHPAVKEIDGELWCENHPYVDTKQS